MQVISTIALWSIIFMVLGRFQENYPILYPFQLGKVTLALGLAVVLAQNAKELTILFRDSPIKKYLITLVVLGFLGIPFSVYPGNAVSSFTLFTQVLLTSSIIVALGRKHLESVSTSIIVVLFLLSVQMFLQKTGGRISVSGTYDPNDIAVLFVVFLPVAIYGLSHEKFMIKLLSLAASGGAVAGIALSGSRGGLLALISVAIYTIFLAKKRKFLLITLCVFGAMVFTAMAGDALWERIQAVRDGTDYNFSTTGDSRIAIWTRSLQIMITRPILGVGIGQFMTGLATLTDSPWKSAHNSFLQIGVELGLGGLWALCSMLFFIYRLSLKGSLAPYLTPRQQNMYTLLRVSALGFCVGGFFVSHAYSPVIYILICYSVIMHYHLADAEKKYLQESIEPDQHEKSSPSHIGKNNSAKRLPQTQTQAQAQAQALARRNIRKSRLATGDLLRKKKRPYDQ